MGKSALYLWCAGLATITFDLLFSFDLGPFTIKIYYFFFLAAAALLLAQEARAGRIWDHARSPLRPPWLFALLLFLYELGMSPFSFTPVKSFAYSVWLLFDLTAVAVPGWLLFRSRPESRRAVLTTLVGAGFFLMAVLLIDLVAFQYGYTAGMIGYNQEVTLSWGMSRAHAFSFEPSYLSTYFSFSLFFLLGEIFADRPVFPRLPLYACATLQLIGILLLGSRTGWLLTLLGGMLLLVHFRRKLLRPEIKRAALGAAAAFGVFCLLMPSHHFANMRDRLVDRIVSGTDGSGNTRLRAMNDAVEFAVDTNGLGVGVGGSFYYFLQKHPEVITPYLHVSLGGEAIMSTWAQILAESGIPGVVLYFLFGASLCWILFRALRRRDDPVTAACLVSAALFFLLGAHLVGNVARTDVWVWFAIWLAFGAEESRA